MSNLSRKIIKLGVIFGAVYVWFLFFYSDFKIATKNIVYTNKICKKPITYKIAELDPKFKTDIDKVKKILEASELIWEITAQKELFKYTDIETADIEVYFIYDNRQENTNKLKDISGDINQKDQNLEIDKSFLENTKLDYESYVTDYKNSLSEHRYQIAVYETLKNKYAQNGYSSAEISDLDAKVLYIKNLESSLNQKQTLLKNKESELRNKLNEVNKSVSELNTDIVKYNTTTKSQPETFREGEFIRDTKGARIYIYEFEDTSNLKRLFAHELGHAIDIDHTEGANSIMYSYNNSKSLELSEQDIIALEDVCSRKNLLLDKIKVLLKL